MIIAVLTHNKTAIQNCTKQVVKTSHFWLKIQKPKREGKTAHQIFGNTNLWCINLLIVWENIRGFGRLKQSISHLTVNWLFNLIQISILDAPHKWTHCVIWHCKKVTMSLSFVIQSFIDNAFIHLTLHYLFAKAISKLLHYSFGISETGIAIWGYSNTLHGKRLGCSCQISKTEDTKKLAIKQSHIFVHSNSRFRWTSLAFSSSIDFVGSFSAL